MLARSVSILIALAGALAAPCAAQAAFPGEPGEIRLLVDRNLNGTHEYERVDAAGSIEAVPGVPGDQINSARSSADGRTVAVQSDVTDTALVFTDEEPVDSIDSCGPAFVAADRLVHIREDGGPCSAAVNRLDGTSSQEPFGDQSVDARDAVTGRPPISSPDGSRLYWVKPASICCGGDVVSMGASGGTTTLLPDDSVDAEDPGNDCDCYLLNRSVSTQVIDASPDGQRLLVTREIRENEQCFGDDSSGAFCDVNPSFRNERHRFVVGEVPVNGGSLTELPAFSTPFGPDEEPPELVPLAYSPAGDELLLDRRGLRDEAGTTVITSHTLVRAGLDGSDEQAITVVDDPPGDGQSFVRLSEAQWLPGADECPAGGGANTRAETSYYGSGSEPSMEARTSLAAGRGGSGGLRVDRVAPRRTIAGGSVTIKGRGLAGKRLEASVGGKRAKLLDRKGSSAVLGVPGKLDPGRHRVRLRRGKERAGASLRVEKGFDGSIDAKLDEARAVTQAVGPGGGTMSATGADGTTFTLEIPAGALAADERVTMTPVARFTDAPFSGPAEGVELEPDGLRLEAPATLRIARRGGFPPDTTGFAMGEELEITRPTGTRGELVLSVEHFSTHGGGALSEQDAVDILSAILAGSANRDLARSEIRSLLTLIGIFDRKFFPAPTLELVEAGFRLAKDLVPPTFCSASEVCRSAFAKAVTSMRALIRAECLRGQLAPSLASLTTMNNLMAEYQLVGGEGLPFEGCAIEIAEVLTEQIVAALDADPLARHQLPRLPRNLTGDLNGDGLTSSFESAKLHAAGFGIMSFPRAPELEAALIAEAERALVKILDGNRRICRESISGDSAAAAHLREGLAYARAIGQLQNEFLSALAECGVAVVITPSRAALKFGQEQKFDAVVTSQDGNEQLGVEFSLSEPGSGSITPDGLYTAPSREGIFQVRATSTLNANRFDTATVVVTPDC